MTILFYFNKFQYFYLDYFGFPISHAIWWKIHAAAKVNCSASNKVSALTRTGVKVCMECARVCVNCNNNSFFITASLEDELLISYEKIRISTFIESWMCVMCLGVSSDRVGKFIPFWLGKAWTNLFITSLFFTLNAPFTSVSRI